MTDLEGKNALLIGANGGIGNAIATALAAAGAKLTVAGRNLSALHDLRDRLRAQQDIECAAISTDVTDDQAVAELVRFAASERGGLHVAINNFGVSHKPAPIGDLEIASLDRVLATTLRGVALAMHHQLPAMNDGGSVVNIASSAGLAGTPGMSGYAAAKHGVIGLTKTAAIDYAPRNIRVNAVAPGPIESGQIMALPEEVRRQVGQHVPLGRMGRPEEVAAAVLWLATGASSYTTGAVLCVDGGRRA